MYTHTQILYVCTKNLQYVLPTVCLVTPLSCFNMTMPVGTKPALKEKWFSKFSVEELGWPAKTPDLNHIQHLWDSHRYIYQSSQINLTVQMYLTVFAVSNASSQCRGV